MSTIQLSYTAAQIDAAIAKVNSLITTISGNIVQLYSDSEIIYPRTKAEAVFFDNDTEKTLDIEYYGIKLNITELMTEVFPLTVNLNESTNAGLYEIGSNITPNIVLDITRKGVDIAELSNVSVSPNDGNLSANHKIYTGEAISFGEKEYSITVQQGGQIENVSAKYEFTNYVYQGVIDSMPVNGEEVRQIIESSWRNDNKVLTKSTIKEETILEAGNYYLFAVKGEISLVVRSAATESPIIGYNYGNNILITRINGTGSDRYSWVVVPAPATNWNFKITNS